MVATVTVQEVTGASGSKSYTSISNRVRLFTKDQATNQVTPQTDYPVPIPAAGFNYSYWKHVCLDIAGSGFTITNIRHYADAPPIGWNFGSGGELRRGNRDSGDHGVPLATDYEQATGTEGTTGYDIGDGSDGHDYFKGETTPTADVASDTSGSPATIDSTSHTSAEKSKAVCLQVKVDTAANGAVQGTQTAETLTWKYDES
jgi:hypothetical protein